MTERFEETVNQTLGKARRNKARRISSIWLVPAVALAIGVWMAYDTVSGRGALVLLNMTHAEGVEPGKTLIKVKDVTVGRVESVTLINDFTQAQARLRMLDGTDNMLTDDAQFWVVKPRIGRDGITGLGTILSGTYIELEPGNGEPGRREFESLAQPPVMRSGEAGVSVRLYGEDANQLTPGDPVMFRGYTVGRIQTVEFDMDTQQHQFRAFIQEPFAELVTANVRFWQSSGISVQLGADGLRVDIGSLESVLAGGVTFDYLNETRTGKQVDDETEFRLFRDRDAAQQEGFTQFADYILLVEQSVRGLSVGAPVEFRGIRIGTVLQVPYTGGENLARSLMEQRVPVLIRLEPERLGSSLGAVDIQTWQQQIEATFERGLRAALKSGNILTGALFVDIVLSDAVQPAETLQQYAQAYRYPIFPMIAGGGGALEQQIGDLLSNLNQFDFATLGEQANATLAASEQALASIETMTHSLTELLKQPEMHDLPARLHATLVELERLLAGYSVDAPVYNDATRAIQSLERILRDLEPFAESLGAQPSSLFFQRAPAPDPTPRRQ